MSTTEQTIAETIIVSIQRGEADDLLQEINRATVERLKRIRAAKAAAVGASLAPGDRRQLSAAMRTGAGTMVTVREVKRTKALVDFDDAVLRLRYPGGATVPMSELIDPDA